jgi:hypothetical protein
MHLLNVRKVLLPTIAAAVAAGLAANQPLAAANPDAGEKVTYTATGIFAAPAINGADTLKMAGEPFTISVVGQSSMKPKLSGPNWDIFKPLTMTGTVNSGLLPGQPIAISSTSVELQETAGADEDILLATFPVEVIGIDLTITARIIIPGGTLNRPLIHPFPTVDMQTTSTVTYADSTASTELGVASGTSIARYNRCRPVVPASPQMP